MASGLLQRVLNDDSSSSAFGFTSALLGNLFGSVVRRAPPQTQVRGLVSRVAMPSPVPATVAKPPATGSISAQVAPPSGVPTGQMSPKLKPLAMGLRF